MKKSVFWGAAAALALVAPGVASAQSGDIGVHIGNIEADSGGDLDRYGLSGAFINPLNGDWVVQFDGQTERLDSFSSAGSSYAAASVGARSSGHALYGFAGFGSALGASTTMLGVGGQIYFNQATVNGSIGYADFDTFDGSVTNVSIDGTWFFTENFGVGGHAGWAEADGSGSDFDWSRLGIDAAWRPDGSNFTITGGYENIDADSSELDYWRIGFRYNFGDGSEHERSRSGASFNGAERLYEDSVIVLF